jgi:hypothetical protein
MRTVGRISTITTVRCGVRGGVAVAVFIGMDTAEQ